MKVIKRNVNLKLANKEVVVCDVLQGFYSDKRIALQLVDSETSEILMTPTACMAGTYNTDLWPSGVTAIRDYSEYEGALDSLVEAGLITPIGRTLPTGYVCVHLVIVNITK